MPAVGKRARLSRAAEFIPSATPSTVFRRKSPFFRAKNFHVVQAVSQPFSFDCGANCPMRAPGFDSTYIFTNYLYWTT